MKFPNAPSNRPGFHLVQISYDESVLEPDSTSDTIQRQVQYRRELNRISPGARITILVLTYGRRSIGFETDGTFFMPVPYRKRFQIPFLVWKALDDLHKRTPIDVVTTQSVQEDGLGSLIFRKMRGVPAVGQVHIDIFHPAARRENFGSAPWRWLMGPIAFWTLAKYDALRVVGSRIRTQLEKLKVPGRIYLVPVAMPIMSLDRDVNAFQERKIIFVGRLEEQKRLDLWLKIASEVARRDPEVSFEIAGVGSQRESLERQALALGLRGRLKFLGFVSYDGLASLYASAKIFLITSSYEGFGRVVAEAMHFEVPVVGYRITGVEDIVEDGKSGFLHVFGDIENTANSLSKLLQDESLRKAMAAAGRDSVDTAFNPARLTREWMDMLYSTGSRNRLPG